jgi:hypothetical protein
MTLKEKDVWPIWEVEVHNGEVLPVRKDDWRDFLSRFDGKEMALILKRRVKSRSRQEEKYYRAVVLKYISEAMCIAPDEAHEFLKELFLTVEEVSPAGYRYTRALSTTELAHDKYDEFIFQKVIPWAATPTEDEGLSQSSGLGLYIPHPNEVDYENL